MPALVVLERMMVPVLLIERNCDIVFHNTAFDDWLGHIQSSIERLTLQQIVFSPTDWLATNAMRTPGAELVKLRHRDGYTVVARMCGSLIKRDHDDLLLVVFEDVTDRLWGQP